MLVPYRRRRIVFLPLLLCLTIVLALVTTSGVSDGVAKPPPKPSGHAPTNPSDQQLSGAAAHKSAVAAEVGRLGAAVAQEESQLRQLEAAQEMAEQKLAYALQKLGEAKAESAAAAKAVTAAQQRVDAAQRQFQTFVQNTYMNGTIGGTTGSLLTATDPNALLQQSAIEGYESDHQLDAVGEMKQASVAKSNADARARLAVKRQKQATDVAAQAKADADAAVTAAIAQKKALEAALAANQHELEHAQYELAILNHERAKFLAYQHQVAVYQAYQKRQAEIRAARARAAALAAAKRAREAAARAARSHTGGSGGGGGGGGYSAPPRPSGGGWSAERGQNAVNRAMAYLGWMYAWAGGDASGPTYGVCAGDGAFNDCHVRGFDCSGLALYAWAPYEYMPHLAMAQYWAVGSYHPSISTLLPGDLVFWSSNGSVSGIHHVAIYIGGGNVIQAPESGSVIQITPVMDVDWGLYGATRPLT